MNAGTKVLTTLALTSAAGQIGGNQKLANAAYIATGKYPYSGLTSSKIKQIDTAVKRLIGKETDNRKVMSMLVAGLVDIRSHWKPERWPLVDPLIDMITEELKDYDVDDNAYEQYERWINEE